MSTPYCKGSLTKVIEDSVVGKMVGTPTKPIGIVYDLKVTGEASAKPSVRTPPLNEENLKFTVEQVMATREDPSSIAAGDQYICPDGGKGELWNNFEALFKSIERDQMKRGVLASQAV